MEALPLLTLLVRARRAVALNFPAPLWVKAELSQATERRGNLYLEFVEKSADAKTLAKVGGTVWSRNYRSVLRKRGPAAAEVLVTGQEVVVQVEVNYSELYGLKLNVLDWDPEFTLGQLELQRRKIVAELSNTNQLGRNGQLRLPPVLQRIAVLSSSRAAGYADFVDQLEHNAFGYCFHQTFFDIAVQGPNVDEEVPAALAVVAADAEHYDAVALLRGGGSRLDLAGFDTLAVGQAIAGCPVPVLVGIGHETDETLPDLVAHRSLKTPTALAEFFINRSAEFEATQINTARQIARWGALHSRRASDGLTRAAGDLRTASTRRLQTEAANLAIADDRIRQSVLGALRQQHQLIEAQTRELAALDPAAILKRGFAYVTVDGQAINRAHQLSAGATMTTHFEDDSVESVVTTLSAPNE